MLRLKRAALAACVLLAAASVALAQGEPDLHRERGAGRQEGERAPAAKADIAALVKALGGRSASAANEAAEELIEAGAEAVPALAEAMKSGRAQTRLYAALALSGIEPKRADAVEVLEHIVRDRREYYLTRRHAAFALARTAAGVRALAALLKDEDEEVRVSAAFAFEELSEGSSDDPAGPHAELVRVIPALVAALKDRSGHVRAVVGEALSQLGSDAEPHLPPQEDAEGGGEQGAGVAAARGAEPTPEEAREARNLALLFLARARMTGDLEFAAREMLVEDFAPRLQSELVVGGNFLDGVFDDRLAAQARPEELSRFYWSLLNFISAGKSHLRAREEDEDDRPTLGEAFPPQVAAVIARNEAFVALVKKLWGVERAAEPEGGGVAATPRAVRVSAERAAGDSAARGGRKDESKQADSAAFISSAQGLNALTADAEEAAKKLREHRATHAEPRAREAGGKGDDESGEAEDAASQPGVSTLAEPYYGYPAKTRLFCVNVIPAGGGASFHLDFVSVDGRLRLLTVTPR